MIKIVCMGKLCKIKNKNENGHNLLVKGTSLSLQHDIQIERKNVINWNI